MSQYWVADLKSNGELHAKAPYDYATLERLPDCPELIGAFAGAIWRSPEGFQVPFPVAASHLSLRWRPTAPTAGIITIREREALMSISLLASGINPDADALTRDALQQYLLQELHGTRYEPAFALLDLPERPLAASINVASPLNPDYLRPVALADRCFAAAYFRFLHLV